jgi:hypothetical protein
MLAQGMVAKCRTVLKQVIGLDLGASQQTELFLQMASIQTTTAR